MDSVRDTPPLGQVLSHDELRAFLAASDLRGVLSLAANWGLIALAFIAATRFHNPLAWLFALVILGGRQLGLGVLMHDCAHRSLFKTPALNEFFGQWFCAYPILSHLPEYRRVHLRHHAKVGTSEDPDLGNYQSYPVSKASLRRKILRDLSGITGLKALTGFVRGGDFISSFAGKAALAGPLLAQGALLLVLWALQHPGLYALWVAAYLTTYMLFARLRQIAEHAAVPKLDATDPRRNTRTTIASALERLTVAPNHVNYHLEHHLLPRVPPYRLPRLHALLNERNYYDAATPILRGYGAVMRHVAS